MSRRVEPSHRSQAARVADDELRFAHSAVAPLCRRDELRGGIDNRHVRTGVHDGGREDALPAADIEDRLSGSGLEEVQHGGDGELPVVSRTAVADPAVVPGRHALPARLGRSAWWPAR